jgi:hypothetical protein
LFSGIWVTAVAEFDKDLQALFRGHRRVVARIGFIGVLEAGKYPHRSLHPYSIELMPDLVPGKINLFPIDNLVNLLAAAGLRVDLKVTKVA